MVICDQEHTRMTHELREYMKLARRKCLAWREKSKEFFAAFCINGYPADQC